MHGQKGATHVNRIVSKNLFNDQYRSQPFMDENVVIMLEILHGMHTIRAYVTIILHLHMAMTMIKASCHGINI